MQFEQLKEDIKQHAKEIGIDKIGFTTADVFTSLKQRLIDHERLNYSSGFEKGTVEERTEPRRLFPEAQSIISIAIAYPSKIKNPPKNKKDAYRGIFCRASWGEDYHHVLRDRLQQLANYIGNRVADFNYKIMVDTGELSDRSVAERAGIGFIGKNTLLITEEYGSFVYLGEMITNIPFAEDERVEDGCGDCNICRTACPTGALVGERTLNAQMCLAYQTQTKQMLPDMFRSKIGTRIYGCDTCQAVCPKNKGIDFHLHEEFEPDGEVAKPLLKPMLTMSNRELKEKFGHVSGFWRGKNPLQRNAIIALAHFKDDTSIEVLIDIIKNDVRPVIRGTAAWALGKIGTEEAENALKIALEKEKEAIVLEEIKKGLTLISEKSK